MKKLLVTSLILGMGTVYAATEKAADNSVATKVAPTVLEDASIMHKGLRVSLNTGNRNIELELKAGGETLTGDDSGQGTAIAVGYEKISTGKIGFMGEISRMAYEVDGVDFTHGGLEGNATYGINNNIYTYGGINLQTIDADSGINESDEFYGDFGLGAGIQLGIGAKVHKNISLEAKYASTLFTQERSLTQNGETVNIEAEYRMSGLQIGVVGTF